MSLLKPVVVSAALSILLSACTGNEPPPQVGGVSGAVVREPTIFPTRAAIAQIAAAPVPARALDDNSKDVPTWDLSGPLPDAVERVVYKDDSPWGRLFAEAVAARGDAVVPTEAMRCVARENAAFYLANGAFPAEMLMRFIAGRCGAPTGLGGTTFSAITADPRASDEQVLADLRDRSRAFIDKALEGGRFEAGFAFVRKGGRAVVALSLAPETVRIERTPIVPGPDGRVMIAGEIPQQATGVRALVNRGRYGYAVCAVDPGTALPRFRISCPVATDDEVAWISVSAMPPGRVLGMPLIEMLVWPSGTPGKTYAKLSRAAGDVAGGASPADIVQEINRVRAEAKLPPVRLAEQQTLTAARLAPHYFAPSDAAGTTSDLIALGLLAGWEVDGMIRNGHFASVQVADAGSWGEVVRSAISRPIGREALLDPSAERIAVGPFSAGRSYGALFTTYALFDAYRHDGDAGTLAAKIAAERAVRRTAPPHWMVELGEEAQRAAESVQLGRRAPEQALHDMLGRASYRLGGRAVKGWVAETTSFDRMHLPPDLTGTPALALGIGVGHHRPEGEPWGRFLVFIVAVDESAGGTMTARREGTATAL